MGWSGRLLDSRGIARQASLHGAGAEEAARRSPTGKQVACNGNHFHFHKNSIDGFVFNNMKGVSREIETPFYYTKSRSQSL